VEAALVQIREARAAKTIVVLFPYMGATASEIFKNWDMFLDESDLYILQARAESLNALIPQVVPAIFNITKAKPGVPLYFYGHSMGAIVAYQLAQHIHRLPVDEQPPLSGLLVGAAQAPTTKLLRGLEEWSPESIRTATDEFIIKSQMMIGTVPADAQSTPELASILRKDLLLLKTLVLVPEDEPLANNKNLLPYPVHAFMGKHDKLVKKDEIEAWKYFTNDFGMTVVEGGHTFLVQQMTSFTTLLQNFFYLPSDQWNPKPAPQKAPEPEKTTVMTAPKEEMMASTTTMMAQSESTSMVPQGSSSETITTSSTKPTTTMTTPKTTPQSSSSSFMSLGIVLMGVLGAWLYSHAQ
jgi:pyochelin biosynthetic protein PchC